MSAQSELATQIRTVTTQLNKISLESSATLQKVEDLKAIIAQQENVSPELQEAVDALAAQAQVVDDLTPDVVAPPAPDAETPQQ
jgi:hypothetical protein